MAEKSLKDQVFEVITSGGKDGATMRIIWRKFNDVKCPEVLNALAELVSEKRIKMSPPCPDWDVASQKYSVV